MIGFSTSNILKTKRCLTRNSYLNNVSNYFIIICLEELLLFNILCRHYLRIFEASWFFKIGNWKFFYYLNSLCQFIDLDTFVK